VNVFDVAEDGGETIGRKHVWPATGFLQISLHTRTYTEEHSCTRSTKSLRMMNWPPVVVATEGT